MKTGPDQPEFTISFLDDLRKVFYTLHPATKETISEGIHYFTLNGFKICVYNTYSDGLQLVFNRNLLTPHFTATFDFQETATPDWNQLITIIIDIADKIHDAGHKKKWFRWKPERIAGA